MTLRDIFFSLFVIGGLPTAYKRPFYGLLLFSWLAYMRGQDLCWGFARQQRWSFLVAAVTVLGYQASRPERWFRRDLRTYVMLALIAVVLLSVAAGGEWSATQINRTFEFVKIVGVALFTTALVNRPGRLRVIVWVIALSLGFYGVKAGLMGVLSGGSAQVLEGPGGMLADNNDFGLAMVLCVPMLLQIGLSETDKHIRRGMLIAVTLTIVTVMMTHSRGAFLSLAATVCVLIWRSPNRLAGFSIGAVGIVLALLLAPASYYERIETLQHYEDDGSAMGRLAAWKTATNMALDNPILGVGLTLFRRNYATYRSFAEGEANRVAHNSYLQIWAECGTPALLLYLSLIVLSLVSIWRVRRLAKQHYFTSWILNYCTMFEASLVGFTVGSTFLNRAHFDLFYHWVALILAFEYIAREQMARGLEHPLRPGTRAPLVHVRRPDFKRRSHKAGFRNTPLPQGSG